MFANKSDLRHSAKADQVQREGEREGGREKERERGREGGRGIMGERERERERDNGRRCSYDLFEPSADIFL